LVTLAALCCAVLAQVGANDQIFGSVTAVDVIEAIRMQTGRELDKKALTMPEIKVGTAYVELHDMVWYCIQVLLGCVGAGKMLGRAWLCRRRRRRRLGARWVARFAALWLRGPALNCLHWRLLLSPLPPLQLAAGL
jgi:hypothetical protein